jgi:hypothetical protein
MRRTVQIHRSYRKALVYPEPAQVRPAPARKNTRRWCRGKVGVEHVLEWRLWFGEVYHQVCATCGRQFFRCCRGEDGQCRCGHHKAIA